jgi:enterobacterial common antigen flippase
MAWWHRVVIESRWVVWRQILETSGATIFSTVSSVATLFITARLLGPDGRGVLAAATSWGLLFATLGSFSIGQVLVHRATGAEQSAWLPEAAGAMIAVIGGSVAIIWTAVAAVYFANPSALFNNMTGAQLLLAVLPVPLIMWNENGRYVLYSLGALRTANAGAILGAAVSLLAVLLFVAVLKWQIAGALLALVASSFATTVVTARHIVRRLEAVKINWRATKEVLRSAGQLHLNAIGTYLFTQASVVILNHYRAPDEVGYYQLAIQCLNLSLVLASAVSAVAYAIVSRNGPNEAWSQQRKLLLQSLGVSFVAASAGWILAPTAIHLIAGHQFDATVPLYRIVSFALVGGTLSAVMASQWIGRGLFWQTSLITLIVGCISVSCDFVLIPKFGMRGAVVSTVVTYALSVVGNGAMAVWVERRWRAVGRPKGSRAALVTAGPW